MLCSEGPSLRLADRPLAMSDLEKQPNFSYGYVYERRAAHYEMATEVINSSIAESPECKRFRQDFPNKHHGTAYKEYFPSLEAIDEEQGEDDASQEVAELGMKYDLSLPDKHYHRAKNMGYLQHRKGRHYRRKKFTKENDFPRRERSVTF